MHFDSLVHFVLFLPPPPPPPNPSPTHKKNPGYEPGEFVFLRVGLYTSVVRNVLLLLLLLFVVVIMFIVTWYLIITLKLSGVRSEYNPAGICRIRLVIWSAKQYKMILEARPIRHSTDTTLYLKKAGLASRNIVHSQNLFCRIGLASSIIHLKCSIFPLKCPVTPKKVTKMLGKHRGFFY